MSPRLCCSQDLCVHFYEHSVNIPLHHLPPSLPQWCTLHLTLLEAKGFTYHGAQEVWGPCRSLRRPTVWHRANVQLTWATIVKKCLLNERLIELLETQILPLEKSIIS